MTTNERAEKMVQATLVGLGEDKSYYEYFLSQLDDAVKEARVLERAEGKEHMNQAFENGYAAAREQAAGIVEIDSVLRSGWKGIAERIRTMTPNVPGGK